MARCSTPSQDDSGRRAVGPDQPQRKTEHVVDARLDVGEVQAFDDDHSGRQQGVMRRRAWGAEDLDREVIDAEQLHAAIDEVLRGGAGDADEVVVELRRAPQPRVVCLEQDAEVFLQIDAREVVAGDPFPRRHLDDAGAAAQQFERQGFGAGAIGQEMARRVDVRPGVDARAKTACCPDRSAVAHPGGRKRRSASWRERVAMIAQRQKRADWR